MKKRVTIAVATATVLGATILLTRPISAHGRSGWGVRAKDTQYRLVPDEIRAGFMEEFKNLSDEERFRLRRHHMGMWSGKHRMIEEFTGLSIDEIKLRIQEGESLGDIIQELGKTEEEAEAFLTEIGSTKVDKIAETHNLSDEDTENLRSRISEWVNKILERWFSK